MRDLQSLLDRCSNESRDLNETEKIAYRFCEDYLDEIQRDFKRREDSGDRSAGDPKEVRNPFHRNYNLSAGTQRATLTIKDKRTYSDLFDREQRGLDNGGFESFGEFLSILASGRYDSRLEKRTWTAGTGVTGGFNVPTMLYEQIWNTVIEDSIVLSRATLFPMENGNVTICCFQNENRQTDGLFGGMVPQWLGETVSSTDVTGKLRTIQLTAKKLALYTEISLEAVNDTLALEAAVNQALATSISYYSDYYLLRGDGIGKPLGVLNDGAIVSKARTGAGAIVFADIVNMYSSLYGPCLKKACWVVSPSCVPSLIQLADTGNHLVWTPSPVYGGAIAGPVPNTLFGLPVLISEKLPSLGTSGDILLADFSNYAVGVTNELILEKSNAPKWSQGIMSYRGIVRLDAHGLWNQTLQSLTEIHWAGRFA
jgi:HK97 family phage major capsid protein